MSTEPTRKVALKPTYVYVASSWRNYAQDAVCATFRAAGIDHCDFKHPGGNQLADATEYVDCLTHPVARSRIRIGF